MRMGKCALWLLVICLYTGLAQKEAYIWCFPDRSGLDFNFSPPQFFRSNLRSEGCASTADREGNLRFYTDGRSVWDRRHELMPGGTGLNGNTMAINAGVIVPYPAEPDLYYVFTADTAGGPNGFCYSIVDMSQREGLGDVTVKNQPLLPSTNESVSAVVHADLSQYWVVVHQYNSDLFSAFLVSDTGLVTEPVNSAVGITINREMRGNIGHIKFSPDGTKLVQSMHYAGMLQCARFDSRTGRVSDAFTIDLGYEVSGIEFSPNGRLLYASSYNEGRVYQFDLSDYSSSAIKHSQVRVGSTPRSPGAMQLAPDGKLYISQNGDSFLGAIGLPDVRGTGCGYDPQAAELISPSRSSFSLPSFVQSYFYVSPEVRVRLSASASTLCLGETLELHAAASGGTGDNYTFEWRSSGDGILAESESTLSGLSPGNTTTYQVKVVNDSGVDFDTMTIPVYPKPVVSVSNDTIIDYGDSVVLHAAGADLFFWSTGDTASSVTVKPLQSQIYTVRGTGGRGCYGSDSVLVEVRPPSLEKVATPTASPPGGDYTGSVEVELDCVTDGSMIWYTLDGSDPADRHNGSRMRYEQGIVIFSVDTVVLRAVGVKENCLDSDQLVVSFCNQDSVGPVIQSAKYYPGRRLDSEGVNDTIRLLISEKYLVNSSSDLLFRDLFRYWGQGGFVSEFDGVASDPLVFYPYGKSVLIVFRSGSFEVAPGKDSISFLDSSSLLTDQSGNAPYFPHKAPIVLDIPVEWRVSAGPNPFRINETPVSSEVFEATGVRYGVGIMVDFVTSVSCSVRIYDALGNVVADELPGVYVGGGRIVFAWDGYNRHGRMVGSGSYAACVRVEDGEGSVSVERKTLRVVR